MCEVQIIIIFMRIVNSAFTIDSDWNKTHVYDICLFSVVCGFEAFINGKHIVGEVKEKEQAHREYRQAISEGHGAYLMDEETPVSDNNNTMYVRRN